MSTFADLLTTARDGAVRAAVELRDAGYRDQPAAFARRDVARERYALLTLFDTLLVRARTACAGERPVLLVVPAGLTHEEVRAGLRDVLGHTNAVAVAQPEDAAQREEIVAACAAEFEVIL